MANGGGVCVRCDVYHGRGKIYRRVFASAIGYDVVGVAARQRFDKGGFDGGSKRFRAVFMARS